MPMPMPEAETFRFKLRFLRATKKLAIHGPRKVDSRAGTDDYIPNEIYAGRSPWEGRCDTVAVPARSGMRIQKDGSPCLFDADCENHNCEILDMSGRRYAQEFDELGNR